MALPRFQKLPAARRHRLIAAAAVEFAARGYEGAVLGTIAEYAGVGKTSIYYYFADKTDLCATVLEEAWQQLRAEGRIDLETLTSDTFWPALEAVARENHRLCRREPWLIAASKLLNRTPLNPAGEGVLNEYEEKRRAWETTFIARGQELGVVRKDLPSDLLVTLAMGFWQTVNLWLLDHAEEAGPEKLIRLSLQLIEIYRSLVAPPQAAVMHPVDETTDGVPGPAPVRKT